MRQAVQPALHALLAPEDLGMLAPVLDGLFTAFEAVHGRRFEITDDDSWLSQDERALLDALDGSAVLSAVMTDALRIAARSTAIVMAQEGDPQQRHSGQDGHHAASLAGRSKLSNGHASARLQLGPYESRSED